jgi:uncharacterized alpha-E superfamily protein
MLSRIANNLFWAGRYLERAEHLSRYYLTHHYNAVEIGTHEFQIQSYNSVFLLSGMSNIPSVEYIKENESDVIHRLLLDMDNFNSLRATIHKGRENFRSARDVISSSLWESVNRLYIRINDVADKNLENEDVRILCEKILRDTLISKALINDSLMHNETWAFLRLGIHIEMATQISRIILTKLTENNVYAETMDLDNTDTYFSLNLLKNTESYDMFKNHYKTLPNLKQTFEFLILEKNFPKSISHNVAKMQSIIIKIADMNGISKNGLILI